MKNWTIMTYLAGDNNLSEDMVTALKGMQAVGGNDYVGITAFYDSGHPFTPSAYYNFTADKRDEPLSECRVDIEIDSRLDQAEAKNDDAIIDFVRWCRKEHPAKNYMLILSGHGDGFLSKVLLRDENPAGFVTMKQLRKLLNEANGILDDKLTILGFDSCVMNMLEVAYELRDAAKILVSSEGLLPNSGWGYDMMLQNIIKTDGEESAEYYAGDFVKRFIRFHSDYAVGGRSVDISACNMSAVEDVVTGIGKLGGLLREELEPVPEDYRAAFCDDDLQEEYKSPQAQILVREKLKKNLLKAHWDSQTYLFDQAVDVGDFCRNLQAECRQLREEMAVFNDKPLYEYKPETKNGRILFKKLTEIEDVCGKTLKALDDFILESGYTGSEYQFSTGVSFFFPWSLMGLMLVVKRYKDMEFTSATKRNWLSFLSRYLYETMRDPRENLVQAVAVSRNGSGYGQAVEVKTGRFSLDSSRFNPDSSRFNPDSSRFNPKSSRFNPPSSKFNPDSSRFNPGSSRFNPDSSRFNPDSSRFNPYSSEGNLDGFLNIFSKMKNMPFTWIEPEKE